MDAMSRLSDKVKRNNEGSKCLAVGVGRGELVPLDGKVRSLRLDWIVSFQLEVAKLMITPMIM